MTLAVLIDADNISAALADGLFSVIERMDEIGRRYAYGDFREPRLAPWNDAAKRHHIRRRRARCKVKNASDWALGLDAMRLLDDGKIGIDGFCIVSSDGDFARLAEHLRKNGTKVYGFGEKKAPKPLRDACTEFTELTLPA